MPAPKAAAGRNDKELAREQETWDTIDIHKVNVDPDGEFGPLPEVPARPGFVQRWMRTKLAGQDDPSNISRKQNQHWRRRDPRTIPADISAPSIYVDGIGDAIGIDGMILVERPVEIHNAYVKRGEDDKQAQKDAVEKSLFNIHSAGDGFGAPKSVENRSEATIGSGVNPMTVESD